MIYVKYKSYVDKKLMIQLHELKSTFIFVY